MDPLAWLHKQLEEADVDLLREMVRAFAENLMSAEAAALCGASYGEWRRDCCADDWGDGNRLR
jgi:transposase-like protein